MGKRLFVCPPFVSCFGGQRKNCCPPYLANGNCAANPDDGYNCLLYNLDNPNMREFGEQLLGIVPGDISKRIVEEARKHVGSRDWSYYGSIGMVCRFHGLSDKCNKFVYDVLTAAGVLVPTIRGTFSRCPPTAGDWGDPSVEIPGWVVVTSSQPGDVVAVKHIHAGTTGHVGIVSGEKTSISQSGLTDEVVENQWGFRGNEEGTVVFRRCQCVSE